MTQTPDASPSRPGAGLGVLLDLPPATVDGQRDMAVFLPG
jgi:hypothetical protein